MIKNGQLLSSGNSRAIAWLHLGVSRIHVIASLPVRFLVIGVLTPASSKGSEWLSLWACGRTEDQVSESSTGLYA